MFSACSSILHEAYTSSSSEKSWAEKPHLPISASISGLRSSRICKSLQTNLSTLVLDKYHRNKQSYRSWKSSTTSSGLQSPFMSFETLEVLLATILRKYHTAEIPYIASLRYEYGCWSWTPTQDCFRRFRVARNPDSSFNAALWTRYPWTASPSTLDMCNGEDKTSMAPASKQRATRFESSPTTDCDELCSSRTGDGGFLAPASLDRSIAIGIISFGPSCTWRSAATRESSCKPYDSSDCDENVRL